MTQYKFTLHGEAFNEGHDAVGAEWTMDLSTQLTPDGYQITRYEDYVSALTTGTTITALASYVTPFVVIQNTDPTNYCSVAWSNVIAPYNSNIQYIYPGASIVIPGIRPGTSVVVTANTATCKIRVMAVVMPPP